GVFDRIVLSTDDPAIANVGRQFCAEVPFLRPAVIAQDRTPSYEVITHCLDALRADGYAPDTVTILQPTSPFRPVAQVRAFIKCLESAIADDLDGALSLVDCRSFHPARMFLVSGADHEAAPARRAFAAMAVPQRRQDLDNYYC